MESVEIQGQLPIFSMTNYQHDNKATLSPTILVVERIREPFSECNHARNLRRALEGQSLPSPCCLPKYQFNTPTGAASPPIGIRDQIIVDPIASRIVKPSGSRVG